MTGIVITHGTDTLEETAYFLNLVVKSDKPVVMVGAMRPATAISADGPMSLLDAVRVATDPKSKGRGVLVALNDTINAARANTKTNTASLQTFSSPEVGALGIITGGKVRYYRQVEREHTTKTPFDVSKLNELPRVDIIYSHANDDGVMADAAVAAGPRALSALAPAWAPSTRTPILFLRRPSPRAWWSSAPTAPAAATSMPRSSGRTA